MIRKRIIVKGVVQGVGFRPNVYKLALEHKISGWVRNDLGGVTIEAQGLSHAVEAFIAAIKHNSPPQSRIDSLTVSALKPGPAGPFTIKESGSAGASSAMIPADLGLCADCRREMLDPSDRRYLYPFTNCTNCGPRFTIVRTLPYDRPKTTMAGFKMCPACAKEYHDPLDRRFHAQPNACPVCGPRVHCFSGGKKVGEGEAVTLAAAALAKGRIVALKSLGGFHLACDASSPTAIDRLRAAKRRPHKPLAIMAPSLRWALRHFDISARERELLTSPLAPIVTLRKLRPGSFGGAAPRLSSVGVMLPYTPLHEALFAALAARGFPGALIMTSGNRRDEPISKDDDEARAALSGRGTGPSAGIADFFLFHDRPIHNRIDDSVVFVGAGEPRYIRMARGAVPAAVRLPFKPKSPLYCAGADLKSSFCLTRGSEAYLSQYIGDLEEAGNRDFHLETYRKMTALLGVKPRRAVADLHPDYFSSALPARLGLKADRCQHHLAHLLSVAAENGLKPPFCGAAFDGTGYGSDGTIWGGEFLSVTGRSWRREGRLRPFRLPGGDAAGVEPWRPLLAMAADCGPAALARAFRLAPSASAASTALKMTSAGVNSPVSSSMGRLFDAVACAAGLGSVSTYEAQGPMELESLCGPRNSSGYKFGISDKDGSIELDWRPVLAAALAEKGPARAARISAKFHLGLAAAAADILARLARRLGTKDVVLCGGVFQNRVLLEWTSELLAARGLRPLANRLSPVNDGCIALGQAYFSAAGIASSPSSK
ncbi:MAG: hydrogenase maturation protein HypF [Elusimicrobia bacterium]|nr:MAG: hydrogenase maturation protein HypF [Elusimicrobiota bacterium]KAF0155640.1 MAG: hydrogenase maturation protein HypF [Elusimicrobiota bacterium]